MRGSLISMTRSRPRDWLVPVIISVLLNLGLFALLVHWIVVEFSAKQAAQRVVTAAPATPEEPPPLDEAFEEPPEPGPVREAPPLPLMASEPWLTAPLAAKDDLRVVPEAVPPGLFDFPEGPAAPGPTRHRGHRTGVGTTTPPPPVPLPEVTVQADEPAPEPEPGAFPDSLLAGLKRSGHVAIPTPRLTLRGGIADRIRERIGEHQVYPEEAVDLGLEGRVKTRFKLDARGRVAGFSVLNPDDVDPLLIEGARRSAEAGAPYPVPEDTLDGSLYLAVACWTDGEGAVKRMRMVESTGRDTLDSAARAMARSTCARETLGWHVVEFEHGFKVRMAAKDGRFVPQLIAGSLPDAWADALRGELQDLIPAMTHTAAITIPITFRLIW